MLSAKRDANECLAKFATLTNELLTSFLEMDDPEYAGRSSEHIMREIVETDTRLRAVVKQCEPSVCVLIISFITSARRVPILYPLCCSQKTNRRTRKPNLQIHLKAEKSR